MENYYSKIENNKTKFIDPDNLLKEFQNRWYIIGYSETHQAIRTFGIDRILDPFMLKQAFYMDPKFDPVLQFQDIFGVFPLKEKNEKIPRSIEANKALKANTIIIIIIKLISFRLG